MCSISINAFIKIFFIFCIMLIINSFSSAQNTLELHTKNHFPKYLAKRTNDDVPYYEMAPYSVGNIHLCIDNLGTIFPPPPMIDPMTGTWVNRMRFPANTIHSYLWQIGIWVGAVVDHDTLVSTSTSFEIYQLGHSAYATHNHELWPNSYPKGEIQRKTIEPLSTYYSDDAKSEQDMITFYSDTLTDPEYLVDDYTDLRPHRPLNIEVKQSSYAWSIGYAADFILFDYDIRNFGGKTLRDVYIGIFVEGSASNYEGLFMKPYDGGYDDLCGFLKTFPTEGLCAGEDTLNIAYVMDNDGYPNEEGDFDHKSPVGVGGVRILKTPSDYDRRSFNWWVTGWQDPSGDFGPRRKETEGNPFRDMGGYPGTPFGDRNKYYLMQNNEHDYDQILTALDHTADGWLPRPEGADEIASGHHPYYLLSFGPYDIPPGSKIPFAFAYVCGEKVHTIPENYEEYFSPYEPGIYLSNLDFSDLARNARWAGWVYDNPGYDTDNDGYRGKFRICCIDSTIADDGSVVCEKSREEYYEGDGIPDFRAATPPPPPVVRITPGIDAFNHGVLRIRWNGLLSESTPDPFTGEIDFEGYRLYLSLDSKKSGFNLINSYDKDDYTRWTWDKYYKEWLVKEPPFTLDSLRSIYGDDFDPLDNQRDNPLTILDANGEYTAYYFNQQDWNMSDLRDTSKIHKRFPDQLCPTTLVHDTAALYYPDQLTEDGYFKYFEYEYLLRNLLPSRLYYVSVTAFDYGAPGFGLSALETNPTINMKEAYPNYTASYVENSMLRVIVYPNPYRADGNYRAFGFEGRGLEDMHYERARELHFANLPHKCTIRIFSIDGDLVREIEHDYPIDHPLSSHDSWDLITRNTQAPVSGIYYYSVESEFENQVGKFVLIM